MQNRSARGRSAGGRSSKRSGGTTAPSNPVLARLEEAETLHQRATRRHDDSSLELFEAAAVAFRDALSGRAAAGGTPLALDAAEQPLRPLSPLRQACALFGLAEAFQGWASRLVERAEAQPSETLTRAAEAQAAANATTLLAQAVGAFAAASGAAEELLAAAAGTAAAGGDGDSTRATAATARHLMEDSVVNAGNALCEWASLLSKAASWPLEARERFKFATSAEDTAAGPAELLLAQAAASPAEAASLAAALPQPRPLLLAAARALVARAVEAYEGAAALPGADDADTRLNLADALVQAAELAAEPSASSDSSDSSSDSPGEEDEEARGLYARAFAAFEEAVSRASSEEGDDLPALLLNWGVALHSAFSKLHGEKKRGKSASSAAAASAAATDAFLSSPLALLEAAEARLRESASFGRGDPAPLCALGDVLCDRAAALFAAAAGETAAAAAGANSADGGGGEESEVSPKRLYERAISEGYGAALAIDRRCAAASAGKGDALLALSRLAAASAAAAAGSSSSSAAAAAASLLAEEAARAFSAALSEAPRLGGLDERGSVIYNAACASARAAALSGGGEGAGAAAVEAATEGARRRVRLLVAGSAVSAREVLRDDDLACLRGEQWLLDVASAEEAAAAEKEGGSAEGDAMRE